MIAPSQAWAMLARHAAADVRSLRLSELRSNLTEEEVDSFVEVYRSSVDAKNGRNTDHTILLDFSRQRMTLETMNHLLRLSAAKETKERIRDLAWGRLAPGSRLRRRNGNEGLSAAPSVSFAHDTNPNYPNTRGQSVDDGEEEERGSMHLALRAPAHRGLTMRDPYSDDKTKNALDEIHAGWERMLALSDSIRQGTRRGASGRPLCDVLVVSAGGTVVPRALEFAYRALLHNPEAVDAASVDSSLISLKTVAGHSKGGESISSMLNLVTTPFKSKSSQDVRGAAAQSNRAHTLHRRRKLRVLRSTDPGALADAVSELSPATTMVVELRVDGAKERERKEISTAAREWLLSGLMGASASGSDKKERAEDISSKHVFVVTASVAGTNSNTFLVPRHSRCEAFGTCSAAGLLPLSVIFGWNVTTSFLDGAHDMDRHFVDANPRHCLPILLALVDLWNEAFLQSTGRAVSPKAAAFGSYPRFVAALESCVLSGSGPNKTGNVVAIQGPSPVIDGGDRALRGACPGPRALSTEFLMTMEDGSSGSTVSGHDSRVCSLLAHADTLAFGSNGGNNRGRFDVSSPGSPPAIQSVDSMVSHGSVNYGGDGAVLTSNQTSTILLCGASSAFTCGQLVALAEHRALVKAWLWDIDPFATTTTFSAEEDRHEAISKRLHQISPGVGDESSPDQSGGHAPEHKTGSIYTATNTVLSHIASTRGQHR